MSSAQASPTQVRRRVVDWDERGKTHLLTLNWGRGRLRRHQSFHSFVAAFCVLNQINLLRFKKYWANFFGEGDDKSIVSLSYALDEPVDVVETVFGKTNPVDWSPDNVVSYCPACIVTGFHASFHEHKWLKRCPVHNIELFRESSTRIGVLCRFDDYVGTLKAMLERHCAGWPTIADPALRAETCKPELLAAYLRWRDEARQADLAWHGTPCTLDQFYSKYGLSHLDIRLGRLAWHTPMSGRLPDLFLVKPWCVTPIVLACDSKTAREMARFVDTRHFPLLLRVYLLSKKLGPRAIAGSASISNAIAQFSAHRDKTHCTCEWGTQGIDRWRTWHRFPAGALSDYRFAACPYEAAAQELHYEWCDFLPEGMRARTNFFLEYCNSVERLARLRLLRIERMSFYRHGPIPLIRLRCSDKTAALLDQILCGLAIAHVDELHHWLAGIARGALPQVRDHFPPNIYLARDQRGVHSVLIWPVGTGRSFQNEAERSWEEGRRLGRRAREMLT